MPASNDRDQPAAERLTPDLRMADTLRPRPARWLWPGRIPIGQITLLVGDPGVGKSLLTVDLAARVSAGQPWPDTRADPAAAAARGALRARVQEALASDAPHPSFDFELDELSDCPHAGSVILASPEDDPAAGIVPRLHAAGAKLTNICLFGGVRPHAADSETRPVRLPEHLPILEQAVRAVAAPRLLVLDPLPNFLTSPVDSGRGGVGAVLAALQATAQRSSIAIVGVTHLTKSRAHKTLHRARGSLAYIAAARSVLLVTADPQNEARRLLIPLKSVYGPPPRPLAFEIASHPNSEVAPHPENESAARANDGPRATAGSCATGGPRATGGSSASANSPCATGGSSASAGSRPTSASFNTASPRLSWYEAENFPADLTDLTAEAASAMCEAVSWLSHALKSGPRPARELMSAAREAGITTATLRRAKRALNIRSTRPPGDSPWLWHRNT